MAGIYGKQAQGEGAGMSEFKELEITVSFSMAVRKEISTERLLEELLSYAAQMAEKAGSDSKASSSFPRVVIVESGK
ncbi:hypothetical protein ACM799_29785 [Pseudomonas aeruginosa]|uniref:hypothetical protein n=2 Tax=Pseudomonas aeruginosa TaxID=287 RepID=UPI000F549804|nr:hypothetical protein [Pseudomonas aeruginosa]MBG5873034.1 hypothetical protein [Pseudomonas aeruginosa]WCV82370.1 hypothetical protein KK198_15990 [Pseudomonas aeruginosa]